MLARFFPRHPAFFAVKKAIELFLASVVKETGSEKLKYLSADLNRNCKFLLRTGCFLPGPLVYAVYPWLPGTVSELPLYGFHQNH